MGDLHPGGAGPGSKPAHGGERRLGRLRQGRKHREVSDDTPLALGEDEGGLLGFRHGPTSSVMYVPFPGDDGVPALG
jgi:hypothetical protein